LRRLSLKTLPSRTTSPAVVLVGAEMEKIFPLNKKWAKHPIEKKEMEKVVLRNSDSLPWALI
jgi:hypothetical protein